MTLKTLTYGSRITETSHDDIFIIAIVVLAVIVAILLCILFYLWRTTRHTVKEIVIFEGRAANETADSDDDVDLGFYPDDFPSETWGKNTLRKKQSSHKQLNRLVSMPKVVGPDEPTRVSPEIMLPITSQVTLTAVDSSLSVHGTDAAEKDAMRDKERLVIYSNPSLLSFTDDADHLEDLIMGYSDRSESTSQDAFRPRQTETEEFGLPPFSAFADIMAGPDTDVSSAVSELDSPPVEYNDVHGDSVLSQNAMFNGHEPQVSDPLTNAPLKTPMEIGYSLVRRGAKGRPSRWLKQGNYTLPNQSSLASQQGQDIVRLSAGQIVLKTLAGELVVATDDGSMYPLNQFNCIVDPHSVAFYRVQASASGGLVLIDLSTDTELASLSSSQVLDACKAFKKRRERTVADMQEAITFAMSEGESSTEFGLPRSLLSMPNGRYAFVNDAGASVPLSVFGVRVEQDRASRFAIASGSDGTYTLFDVVLARLVGSVKRTSVPDRLLKFQDGQDELPAL
ncbi:uncharacterized protein LOC135826632 [Sycon ciliatum]|uniref:uncharacterized protein LOC135826632 n=1 Tax=Sycon ciliatum TaxID=27933 RepID=UPI0031F6F7F1